MKKALLLVVTLVFIQSCAFDQKIYTQKIAGRFILSKTYKPDNASLEYKDQENSSIGLMDGCQLVKYDSVNKVIYAAAGHTYCIIQIKDDNTTNFKLAYNKFNVDESVFLLKTDSCKYCKTIYTIKGF